jgi:hypothetical protein
MAVLPSRSCAWIARQLYSSVDGGEEVLKEGSYTTSNPGTYTVVNQCESCSVMWYDYVFYTQLTYDTTPPTVWPPSGFYSEPGGAGLYYTP